MQEKTSQSDSFFPPNLKSSKANEGNSFRICFSMVDGIFD